MNLVPLMHWPADLPAFLGEPALRAMLVACVTALVTALTRPKRAAVRLYIWTGVLYVALAMPLLGVLLPRIKLPVPALPWPVAARVTAPTTPVAPAEKTPVPALNSTDGNAQSTLPNISETQTAFHSSEVTPPETPSPIGKPALAKILERVNWKAIIAGIYFSGLVLLLARLLLGMRGSRRLAASAELISTPYFLRKDEIEDAHNSAALDLLVSLSRLAGLKHPPRLRESAALSVPATVGLRQPIILLPAGWRTWTQNKLEAVLVHEISHVARRDGLTQVLSLVHRAIFWFSPLAWWLDRHLSELAEEASDEAALAGGADRTLYAETLLGFFAQLETVPGRIRWQALSMADRAGSGSAERRVDRILTWKRATAPKKSVIFGLLALAVPVIFLSASLRPFIAYAKSQTQSEPALASQPAPAVKNEPEASVAVGAENAVPATPALPTQEAAGQKKEDTQPEKQSTTSDMLTNRSGSYFYGYGSGPRYVILTGDARSVSMSGNNEDLRHALALRKSIKGDFIWFERDEKPYIITDPTFIAKAVALFAPQEELGRKQSDLGRQQEELGRQQEALGGLMEKVAVKVPDITADLERIRARLKELQATGATQDELGSVQKQLGELQSVIGRVQSKAGRQQSVIGGRQGELGRRQGDLGKQQGELGRQQAELARKASSQLRGMFDDAITKGIAKPE